MQKAQGAVYRKTENRGRFCGKTLKPLVRNFCEVVASRPLHKAGPHSDLDYFLSEMDLVAGCSDFGILWDLLSRVLTSVQVASLTWVSSLAWNSEFLEGLEDVAFIRLAIDGPSYLTIFLIASCGVLAFAAYGIFTFTIGDMCGGLDEVVWTRLRKFPTFTMDCTFLFIQPLEYSDSGFELFFGVGLLPLISNIADIFHCQYGHVYRHDSIACWEGIHVLYVIMAVISLVIVALGLFVTSNEHEQKAHHKLKDKRVCDCCGCRYEKVRNATSLQRSALGLT